MNEERFGMVVLSVGADAAAGCGGTGPPLRARPPRLRVRPHTVPRTPVDTGRPGIFVAGAAAGPADIADSVTQGSAAAARVCAFSAGACRPAGAAAAGAGPAARRPAATVAAAGPRRIGVFACDCAGDIGSRGRPAEVLRLRRRASRGVAVPCRALRLPARRHGADRAGGPREGSGRRGRRGVQPADIRAAFREIARRARCSSHRCARSAPPCTAPIPPGRRARRASCCASPSEQARRAPVPALRPCRHPGAQRPWSSAAVWRD